MKSIVFIITIGYSFTSWGQKQPESSSVQNKVLIKPHSAQSTPIPIRTPLPQFSHKDWDGILKQTVSWQGNVDYLKIKKEYSPQLSSYLKRLQQVTKLAYAKMTLEEKFVFFINAYNAITVDLIVQHWPIKSIKDIPSGKGLFSLFTTPWKKEVIDFFNGEIKTLDNIEHDVLRVQFKDLPYWYMLHVAIVCAAKSCPKLRNEAYEASRVLKQLEEEARYFVLNQSKNRFDVAKKTLFVSKIFDWFAKDFTSITVPGFFSKFGVKVPTDVDISYMDYDWSLNG